MKTITSKASTTLLFCYTLFLFSANDALAGAVTGCPKGQLCNPLSVNSISELLLALLNILVIVMIPIVIFFIIYAGFLFVTAQGNAEQVQNAKRALLYALIGGVLIIGAEAITAIIEQIVADFQG